MNELGKGDLVVVIKGHECFIGRILPVISSGPYAYNTIYCRKCTKWIDVKGSNLLEVLTSNKYMPQAWVKKIPPIEELDRLIMEKELETIQ